MSVWVRQFKREACWALSNIAAGPAEHRQAVFDAGVLRQVVQLASVRRGIALPRMQCVGKGRVVVAVADTSTLRSHAHARVTRCS